MSTNQVPFVRPEKKPAPTRRGLLRPASAITPRPVHWVWKDRLPIGSFVLLGGREGIGKSIVSCTIAADITRGRLPGRCFGTPRSVIIAAHEDSLEHTVVPRCMAAGADLDRIYQVTMQTPAGGTDTLSLPHDLAALEALINEVQAAVVIPSICRHLPSRLHLVPPAEGPDAA